MWPYKAFHAGRYGSVTVLKPMAQRQNGTKEKMANYRTYYKITGITTR